MVLGPLLLELKMNPRVVSATSAMAVLVTSSSAAVQFMILNLVLYDLAALYMVAGVVATIIGQTLITWLIKKYQRPSFIVISIAAVLSLATIMMTISGIVRTIQDAQNNNLGFKSLC